MSSLILFLFTLTSFAQSALKIQSMHLKPNNEISRMLTARVESESGEIFSIEAPVVLTKITDRVVFGNKLVVIGEAGRAQAVVIFDLASRRVIDWFYCYFPQRPSRSLIAFVEWYPSLGSPQANDVVLIYDLRKSAKENRLPSVQNDQIPADLSDAPFRVGLPVYPSSAVEARGYNRSEDGTPIQVMAHTFAMLQKHKLIFAIANGSELEVAKTSLVVVDVLHPGAKPALTVDVPTTALKRKGENPRYVLVEKIKAVSPARVELYESRKAYGVTSFAVAVPSEGPQEP